ncbi:MAG TPA: hypothetical protein P5526_02805 [Anaerolineae bacterium]|nr:hypothetical protein [Anaerolineae bacterium]MCB9108138.1 hypothetical protein [Anaerolineales bacterium]HRV91075.1 hypothetical protein [Anaerolineae bacterium]
MGISRQLIVASILLAFITVNCTLAQPVIDRVRERRDALVAYVSDEEPTPERPMPTPRPTFTPTPDFTDTPTVTPTPTITPIPTETPTPVPTDTPVATDTPEPTETPTPAPIPPTPTPGPPTDTPEPEPTATPDFPFKIKEQGNREFQKTSVNFVSSIVAVTDANGTPIGGYKLVGTNNTGQSYQSAESSWRYDALSGLEGYVKQGNIKFEPPGGFNDSTWTVFIVDSAGNQVSAPISLTYPSDPSQRAWDFIWWSQ